MPKPGQKSVTLKEKTYKLAKDNADKESRKREKKGGKKLSVAGFITEIINEKTMETSKDG